jgi:hypothetical protein
MNTVIKNEKTNKNLLNVAGITKSLESKFNEINISHNEYNEDKVHMGKITLKYLHHYTP